MRIVFVLFYFALLWLTVIGLFKDRALGLELQLLDSEDIPKT